MQDRNGLAVRRGREAIAVNSAQASCKDITPAEEIYFDGFRSLCQFHKWDSEAMFRLFYSNWRGFLEACESPIEEVVASCLTLINLHTLAIGREFCFEQQTKIGKYRVDFLVCVEGQQFVIECDGHDYHERTKEQAARDRSRDRYLAIRGVPTLRFTGSELHTNPGKCFDDINAFALSLTGVDVEDMAGGCKK